MQEILAPVSIKALELICPMETFIMLESICVEKLTEEMTGLLFEGTEVEFLVFLLFNGLSKGVPVPLAGELSYCVFCFFLQA